MQKMNRQEYKKKEAELKEKARNKGYTESNIYEFPPLYHLAEAELVRQARQAGYSESRLYYYPFLADFKAKYQRPATASEIYQRIQRQRLNDDWQNALKLASGEQSININYEDYNLTMKDILTKLKLHKTTLHRQLKRIEATPRVVYEHNLFTYIIISAGTNKIRRFKLKTPDNI